MKFDRNVIYKSFLIGLFMTALGMALQVAKGMLVFKKAPPRLDFILAVTICYIATGFLYSLGYFMLRVSIPGKSAASKGLRYAFLIYFAVAFGNFIGVIGLDFKGGSALLTPYKLESYFIALIDGINFAVTGIILGLVAEKQPIVPVPYRFPRAKQLMVSLLGFFLFPSSLALCFKAMTLALPTGLAFTPDTERWFYIGTFAPLAITGAAIPIFYDIARGSFDGAGYRKGLNFFLFYYLCFWLINILFGLPFGYTPQTIVDFLVGSILPLLILILASEAARPSEASI
jgi:hypothetical protein